MLNNCYTLIYDLGELFLLSNDELVLIGGCMCSKCFHFLSLVSRLLCLFCLNGPFFVLLTCDIGVYLQVYIHILILNVHRSWVPIQLPSGDNMGSTWEELWLYEPS